MIILLLFFRPILKKSSEDLTAPSLLPPNSTISILKNLGVSKTKRRSTGEDGKGEHVRIRSPSPLSRNDHVRIRTPSQDSWSGEEDAPQPILRLGSKSTFILYNVLLKIFVYFIFFSIQKEMYLFNFFVHVGDSKWLLIRIKGSWR